MEIEQRVVQVVYKNWRGETAVRTIIPKEIVFDANQFHPQPQWLLRVYDCERKAERLYALADIKEWRPQQAQVTTLRDANP